MSFRTLFSFAFIKFYFCCELDISIVEFLLVCSIFPDWSIWYIMFLIISSLFLACPRNRRKKGSLQKFNSSSVSLIYVCKTSLTKVTLRGVGQLQTKLLYSFTSSRLNF